LPPGSPDPFATSALKRTSRNLGRGSQLGFSKTLLHSGFLENKDSSLFHTQDPIVPPRGRRTRMEGSLSEAEQDPVLCLEFAVSSPSPFSLGTGTHFCCGTSHTPLALEDAEPRCPACTPTRLVALQRATVHRGHCSVPRLTQAWIESNLEAGSLPPLQDVCPCGTPF
jgi:hypothetical protein